MLAQISSSISWLSSLPFFSAGLPTLYQAFLSHFVNLLSLSSILPVIPLLHRVISAAETEKFQTSIPWVVIYWFACSAWFVRLSWLPAKWPVKFILIWFIPDFLHWHVVLKQELEVFLYPFISFHSHDSVDLYCESAVSCQVKNSPSRFPSEQGSLWISTLTRSDRLILT